MIKYFLVCNGSKVHLIDLPFKHKHEEVAVTDIEMKLSRNRNLHFEDAVRDAYARLTGRYNSASGVMELLKILLANDHHLLSKNDGYVFTLSKDFFPLRFEARSVFKTIVIGNFYGTVTSTFDEQLPCFCNWLDQLNGFSGVSKLMLKQFIAADFSIVATSENREVLLIEVVNGEIVCALEHTFAYLSDS